MNGRRAREVHAALLSAFPTRGDVERLAKFALDVELDHVAGGEDLRDLVFELLRWAESQNRMSELLAKAREMNPGNLELAGAGSRPRWPWIAAVVTVLVLLATAAIVASRQKADPIAEQQTEVTAPLHPSTNPTPATEGSVDIEASGEGSKGVAGDVTARSTRIVAEDKAIGTEGNVKANNVTVRAAGGATGVSGSVVAPPSR